MAGGLSASAEARAVATALATYGEGTVKFTDVMIAAAARNADCTTLYTFDKRAAPQASTTLIGKGVGQQRDSRKLL